MFEQSHTSSSKKQMEPQATPSPDGPSERLPAAPPPPTHSRADRERIGRELVRNTLTTALGEIAQLAPAWVQDPLYRVLYGAATGPVQLARLADAVKKLFAVANRDKDAFDYLAAKLPHLVRDLSVEARAKLIGSAFKDLSARRAAVVAARIIQSGDDLGTARSIMIHAGRERLLRRQVSPLRETLAIIELSPLINSIALPPKPSPSTSRKQISMTLELLSAALRDQLRVCNADPKLKATAHARERRSSIQANLKIIAKIHDSGDELRLVRAQTRRLIEKVVLETRYALKLTGETNRRTGERKDWTQKEIADVGKVLAHYSDAMVLFTPRLYELRRQTNGAGGENIMGECYFTGRIGICDRARTGTFHEEKQRGYSGVAFVFLHELAHRIQFGRFTGSAYHRESGEMLGPGNPLYDMDRFCKLSGWVRFPRTRFVADKLPKGHPHRKITLDGEVYPLGRTIKHQGREHILVYDAGEKELYGFDAQAQFSIDRYAMTNPHEDWAEAKADYVGLPERLIRLAAKKFAYFEERFRLHRNEPKTLELLDKYLARESASATPPAPAKSPGVIGELKRLGAKFWAGPISVCDLRQNTAVERKQSYFAFRFERLQDPSEQAAVLARLLGKMTEEDLRQDRLAPPSEFLGLTPAERLRAFRNLIENQPLRLKLAESALGEIYGGRYNPALLLLEKAFYAGHEIGFKTARGGRRGHVPMLQQICDFVGVPIPKQNSYFANSEPHNERIKDLIGNARRKLATLVDFLRGEYQLEDGSWKKLDRGAFDLVVFVDDEMKNLAAVKGHADHEGLEDRLVVLDVKKMDGRRIWRQFVEDLERHPPEPYFSKKNIYFFDIDGTLVNVPANMYVRRKSDGAVLGGEISQEAYSHAPSPPEWFRRRHGEFPAVPVEDMEMDFNDFILGERIAKQLHDRMFHLKQYAEAA